MPTIFFFSVTLCKKGILNQGVTEVYMGMVGREEHCLEKKFQGRSSQDADEVMRETGLRKNPEALPETYCLPQHFKMGF